MVVEANRRPTAFGIYTHLLMLGNSDMTHSKCQNDHPASTAIGNGQKSHHSTSLLKL